MYRMNKKLKRTVRRKKPEAQSAARAIKTDAVFWNRTHLRESGPSLSIPVWKENGVKSYYLQTKPLIASIRSVRAEAFFM